MNYHTSDSLQLIARERLRQRTREADAERLAREIRGTEKRSRRRLLTIGLALRAIAQPDRARRRRTAMRAEPHHVAARLGLDEASIAVGGADEIVTLGRKAGEVEIGGSVAGNFVRAPASYGPGWARKSR